MYLYGFELDISATVASEWHGSASYYRFRPHDKSRVGWFGTKRAAG